MARVKGERSSSAPDRDAARTSQPPGPLETEGPAPGVSPAAHIAGLQRTAGNRATNVYVQMLGSAKKTTLDKLIEASKGNWIGDVDEENCLLLLAQLRGDELTTAKDDAKLIGRLAAAFNADEMIRMCSLLPFSVAQKLFWCKRAGVLDDVPLAFVKGWVSLAPKAHVLDLMKHQDLFDLIRNRLPVPPSVVLSGAFPAAAVLEVYGGTIAAARWLGRSTPEQVVQELAPVGAAADKVKAAKQRLVEAGLWAGVVSGLPKGGALSLATKAAMLRLVTADNGEAVTLFPVRFNKPLTGTWTALDVLGVWTQLDVLPDADVSANTVLAAFQAIAGDAGFWSGGNTIQLGAGLRTSTMGPTRLPHTVRHEVGHAVHDMLGATVNPWLRQGVQFWYHPGGTAGIAQLITDFGGWPATYLNDQNVATPFGAAEKQAVNNMLAGHINSSSWTAKTALPTAPTRTPGTPGPVAPAEYLRLVWDAMPAGLRQCFAGSTPTWFNQYTTHPRGTNGFTFWNHWYSKPYYFGPVAKAAIAATGDNYSAMSEKEFFANCYAEYFADPAGAKDKTKWGGSLSADVKSFFKEHIVERHPYLYATGSGAGSSLSPSPNQVEQP